MNKILFLVISYCYKATKSFYFTIKTLFICTICLLLNDLPALSANEYEINIGKLPHLNLKDAIEWRIEDLKPLEKSLFLIYIDGKEECHKTSCGPESGQQFYQLLILNADTKKIQNLNKFYDPLGKYIGYSKEYLDDGKNYKSIFFVNKKNQFKIVHALPDGYGLEYKSDRNLFMKNEYYDTFIVLPVANAIIAIDNKQEFSKYPINQQAMGDIHQEKTVIPTNILVNNSSFISRGSLLINENKNLLVTWQDEKIYIIYDVDFNAKTTNIDTNKKITGKNLIKNKNYRIYSAIINDNGSQIFSILFTQPRLRKQLKVYDISNIKQKKIFNRKAECNTREKDYTDFIQYNKKEDLVLVCNKHENSCKIYDTKTCNYNYENIELKEEGIENIMKDAMFYNNNQVIIRNNKKIFLFTYKNATSYSLPTLASTVASTVIPNSSYQPITKSIEQTTQKIVLTTSARSSVDPLTTESITDKPRIHTSTHSSNATTCNLASYSVFLPVIFLALLIKNKFIY